MELKNSIFLLILFCLKCVFSQRFFSDLEIVMKKIVPFNYVNYSIITQTPGMKNPNYLFII